MPPASCRFTPGPPSGIQLPNWPWKYVSGPSFSEVRIEGSSANWPVPRLFVKLPLGMIGPELEGDLEHLAVEQERLGAEVHVAETGLGRCPALVDLPVGIFDEEAAALARRLLVEGDLLEPGGEIGDRPVLPLRGKAVGRLHVIDPELVAVGPRHVLEVVVADAGHGPRPSVVGEERSVGRGYP